MGLKFEILKNLKKVLRKNLEIHVVSELGLSRLKTVAGFSGTNNKQPTDIPYSKINKYPTILNKSSTILIHTQKTNLIASPPPPDP